MDIRTSPTTLLRWGHVDQRLTEAILGVAAVAAVAVPGTALQAAVADRLDVHVELAERAAGVSASTAGRFMLAPAGSTEVMIHDPQFVERLAYAIPRMLTAFLVAVVVWQMLRVFGSLRRNDPFSRTNSQRVTAMALTVYAGGALWAIADFGCAFFLAGRTFDAFGGTDTSPVTLSATFTAAPLIFGTVVAGLSEFFRRGAALSEDVAGLV